MNDELTCTFGLLLDNFGIIKREDLKNGQLLVMHTILPRPVVSFVRLIVARKNQLIHSTAIKESSMNKKNKK